MTFKSKLEQCKERIGELWEYKIFRYTIFLQVFYVILSAVLVLIFLRDQSDFLVFYQVGGVFINDLSDLYNQSNYLWDFRYFPLSAVFFVPFYLLGFDAGFIVFQILNVFMNILISIIMYKIIMHVRGVDHETEEKRVVTYICIYLMALPQVFNYILGQINLIITFLIVLSLYLFLYYKDTKWDFIASIILGISILIKPITIFMIPFVIIMNIDYKEKKVIFDPKRTFIRIIGVILPLSLNIIVFLIYPILWNGFIVTNFTRSTFITTNASFSITRLFINLFYTLSINFSQLILFLGIILIIGGLGFIAYILGNYEPNSIIYGYLFGIIIMFLVYFDSWDHHILNLTPILIILIFLLPRKSEVTRKYVKPTLFFISFLDLLFMGIYLLVEPWFPFNFGTTIFLIITLFGICNLGLDNASKVREID